MKTLKKLFNNSHILLVLLLLAVFAGCSDDDDEKQGSTGSTGSTAASGTLEKLFSYPIIQSCSSCHYGGASGPDLSKANFTSSLVGKKRTDFNWDDFLIVTADCGTNTPYVDAGGNPIKSSVLNSISQTYNDGSCTSAIGTHEANNAVLSDAALQDFVLWIENNTPAN